MKNKIIVTTLLITLQLCLAGCSSDDAPAVQAVINNTGGGGNSGGTTKLYNSLGPIAGMGPYESFTLNADGTAEYFLAFIGTGWTKAVGTYSIDQSTNDITLSLTYTEASTAIASVCGVAFVQALPYVEVDANTIILPHYGAADGNYVIDSVSGVAIPDVSAMPDICP